MNLLEYAKRELEQHMAKDGYNDLLKHAVLELIEVFENQQHSGMSAPIVLSLFSRLADYKPLSPLTGEDSEWDESPFSNDSTQQNNRLSCVFREGNDNSTAYNSQGKLFSQDGGKTWYSCRDSAVPITFPYVVPDGPELVILSETPPVNNEPEPTLEETLSAIKNALGPDFVVEELPKNNNNIS